MTTLPLMIDVHCHTRDFNQKHKGTFETETKAALAGGFGTVLTMPNTDPSITSRSRLVKARHKADGRIYCDLGFHFGTNGYNMSEFAGVKDLVYGLKIYLNPTTGNLELKDPRYVERVFATWTVDKPILVHAEGANLVEKVLALAEKHKRRLHICHISLKEEVRLIHNAKRNGIKVTAEVCPHHCIFTEDDLPRLGSYGLMKPPLGTIKDVEAVWSGIKGQVIDIVATDHAPHSPEEKASERPPFGVIGEPAFSVMWMQFSQRGFQIEDLVRLMHETPALMFGIQTDEQSYMEVDLDDEFEFKREMIQSKAGRSPYEGMRVRGRIRRIVLHGKEVMHDGEILARNGRVI